MKILIMGLPDSGKTVLASHLFAELKKQGKNVIWYNADIIREIFEDWDFSEEGRLRQATRMSRLARDKKDTFVICDFVAPIPKMREIFDADFTIWIDTIDSGRFEDTNKIFVNPDNYDVRVTEQDTDKWIEIILGKINRS